MAPSTRQLQAEFDRIADLPDAGWDPNAVYHPFLLRQLPQPCSFLLDLGCGTGAFCRAAAPYAAAILGLDLSPRMLAHAHARAAHLPHLRFACHDIATLPALPSPPTAIVAIAALHHLPWPACLTPLRQALAPGGVLLILDLYRPAAWVDWGWQAAGYAAAGLGRLLASGRLRAPRAHRAAWDAHAAAERYPTLAEVRAGAAALLPGAIIRRHLLFRYSLVWRAGGLTTA